MAGKIMITGKKGNLLAKQTAKLAMQLLAEKNIPFETDKNFFGKGTPLAKTNASLVLTFGGDGTLLAVYRELGKRIPIVGINCGNRGFLKAYHHTQIEQAIDDIGNYNVMFLERERIKARVDGKVVGEALNEALIVPQKAGRIMRYKMRIGNEERKEAGDGLIVATPTGSTAHALSAGGPIVKGNASVFVVVSINPVDASNRPLIINDHEKIIVNEFANSKPELILDGQRRFKIRKKVELEKGSTVLLAVKNQN